VVSDKLPIIDRELLNRIIEWKEEIDNAILPKGRLEEDISYLNQDTKIDAVAFSKFMMVESF
jgi:hypothetical protein